jgi:hypothetical protein
MFNRQRLIPQPTNNVFDLAFAYWGPEPVKFTSFLFPPAKQITCKLSEPTSRWLYYVV